MNNAKSFKLKEFKASWRSNPLVVNAWGGGHTHETDPTRRGWRIRPVKENRKGAILFGRPGKPGCFSVVSLSDGELDIAMYDGRPEDVSDYLRTGQHCEGSWDPDYHEAKNISGWALEFVQEIELRERNGWFGDAE